MCLAREKESGEKYRAVFCRADSGKTLHIKAENQVAEAINFALIRSMIISQVEREEARGRKKSRWGKGGSKGRRGLKSRRRLDYRPRRNVSRQRRTGRPSAAATLARKMAVKLLAEYDISCEKLARNNSSLATVRG